MEREIEWMARKTFELQQFIQITKRNVRDKFFKQFFMKQSSKVYSSKFENVSTRERKKLTKGIFYVIFSLKDESNCAM